MNDYLIPIGKMAEYNRVSIAALRLYDKLGLLRPQFVNPSNGYRYYALHQNARLDMIIYMQELGMTLGEIADVLAKEDITLIEDILSKENERIHEQLRTLKSRHDAVERAIRSIERYRKSPATGTISLEYIDRRMFFGIPCPVNFYEQGIEGYEQALIPLRRNMVSEGIMHVHTYNIGTTIAKENFEQGRFVPENIFAFMEKDRRQLSTGISALDSGMFACIYADNYDDEIPYAKRLLEHCLAQGYSIAGDYICEVLTEFNVFSSERRSMFYRLQVPIRFEK